MNTTHTTPSIEENSMNPAASQPAASPLIRWAGLSAVVAGIIFAGIQPIHPPDVVASVTTGAWAIITQLKTAMCLLFLLGLAGIYARQANRAGRLGVVGALLFSLSWAVQTPFVFAETFILPLLATDAPKFVDGVLGVSHGRASEVDLGALPALYAVVGISYMLGGLLLGIATLRAGVLPRGAAGLLSVTAILTPAAVLLPHHIQRLAAVPMGVALAWLGYALWSARREAASQASVFVTGGRRAQLLPATAA
ncbi:MAG: hypothetical protein AVDCRST_MAG77-4777 [uncultured Chloroflexi bacterium]|uniref:Uncharacterized protein n=1 Tax=uncultured Chloroflexota bacterium TaxID=166587 RepID=A0A6J4JSU1_9CHLR|nr:MAG: hypothetical protein AVDCRST_MAG77-4777 [uncultured Chloroflexota bacterium]